MILWWSMKYYKLMMTIEMTDDDDVILFNSGICVHVYSYWYSDDSMPIIWYDMYEFDLDSRTVDIIYSLRWPLENLMMVLLICIVIGDCIDNNDDDDDMILLCEIIDGGNVMCMVKYCYYLSIGDVIIVMTLCIDTKRVHCCYYWLIVSFVLLHWCVIMLLLLFWCWFVVVLMELFWLLCRWCGVIVLCSCYHSRLFVMFVLNYQCGIGRVLMCSLCLTFPIVIVASVLLFIDRIGMVVYITVIDGDPALLTMVDAVYACGMWRYCWGGGIVVTRLTVELIAANVIGWIDCGMKYCTFVVTIVACYIDHLWGNASVLWLYIQWLHSISIDDDCVLQYM